MMLAWLLSSLWLALLGFAQLGLSMPRHHRDVFGAASPPSAWLSRFAGFAFLGVALAPCARAFPLSVAIVVWFGMLMVAAFLIVASLSWRPRLLRWMRYPTFPPRKMKTRDR